MLGINANFDLERQFMVKPDLRYDDTDNRGQVIILFLIRNLQLKLSGIKILLWMLRVNMLSLMI